MPDIFISNTNSSSADINEVNPDHDSIENNFEKETVSKIKGKKVNVFTTFRLDPEELSYDDLDPDEKIILFLRRHFITNFLWIVEGVGLILIPLLLNIGLSIAKINLNGIPSGIGFFSLLFYYFLVFQFFYLNFLNWFFNISLITNKKVVDIDFKILFSKNVSATKISQIEDVSLNEVGLIRSIFDYGDVYVQTAGTIDNFESLAVPHPEKVVHIIGDLIGGETHA